MLPTNPRYQAKGKALVPVLGYDNLYLPYVEVEIALLQVLGEAGIIPPEEFALLTTEVIASLRTITTSEVDVIERKKKHDIRSLIQVIQDRLPPALRRWIHVMLTSYDVIDTGRALQFVGAHRVIVAKLKQLLPLFAERTVEHADTLMIGRTHGQHALPITAGFWLATILSRLVAGTEALNLAAENLVGKISGAVGAYNAQVGLGTYRLASGLTLEERVLGLLGLRPALVSTQILPPEPISDYLFAALKLIAVFGQFGNDARQLMRSEIGEVAEEFVEGQSGSSTMAQKHNPINFENLVGVWEGSEAEFLKVLLTMTTEHQRDLTGSSLLRDLPSIVVNLLRQIETLLAPNDKGKSFLSRITINPEACQKNLLMSAHLVMAEPLYIAIQRYGFAGDAHALVKDKLVPVATKSREQLIDVLERAAQHPDMVEYPDQPSADWQIFADALRGIPPEVRETLRHPERYIGRAPQIARETAERARQLAALL